MATTKTAVDSKAQDYWTEYFGEYGKQFVREIPRTIKAALLPEFSRQAAKAKQRFDVTSSTVVPLGYRVSDKGALSLDGVIKVAFQADKGKRRTAARLFVAEFSPGGDLVSIKTQRAPSA